MHCDIHVKQYYLSIAHTAPELNIIIICNNNIIIVIRTNYKVTRLVGRRFGFGRLWDKYPTIVV